jgi:hypothetical protein
MMESLFILNKKNICISFTNKRINLIQLKILFIKLKYIMSSELQTSCPNMQTALRRVCLTCSLGLFPLTLVVEPTLNMWAFFCLKHIRI